MQPHELVDAIVKSVYFRLSDEELQARKERRDEFFMAIRKKHGVARSQAEIFLHELQYQLDIVAA